MRVTDPNPNLVFFVDTGIKTIFPDDRDFLYYQNSVDAHQACPPKNCNYKKSDNGFAGPCGSPASPQTTSPKNGKLVDEKWGVGTFQTDKSAGISTFS